MSLSPHGASGAPRRAAARRAPAQPGDASLLGATAQQECAIRRLCRRVAVDESGATAIEYGLIVAGISLAVIAIVFAFGEDIEAYYQAIEINGAGESRAPPARHLVFVAVTALLDDDHRFAAP